MKWTCLILISFLSVSSSYVQGISSEELFDNPNILALKISPDSLQTAGHILDGNEYLVVFDHKKKKFDSLVKFDRSHLELMDFGWVDNNTLHFQYRDSRSKKDTHGFADLRVVDGDVKFDVRYVELEGYVVDYLSATDDEIMFSRRAGKDKSHQKVYVATVSQLLSKDFNRKNRFGVDLEGALHYVWDSSSEALLSIFIENKNLVIAALQKGARSWDNIYRIESAAEEFLPVSMVDQKKMIVLSNKITDKVSLIEYDIETSQFGDVLYQHERYDLVDADIYVDEETGEVRVKSVAYVDHGRRAVRYFLGEDIKQNQLLEKAFPNKQVAVVSSGVKSDKKVLLVYSASDPGTYYLFDAKTLEAALIGDRYFDFDNTGLSEPQAVVTEVGGGVTLESILTEPTSNGNQVLLVMPHGGPVGVRDYAEFNPEVQYFVSRGFTVLQVNFRGSSGFGKEFSDSGRGEWGKAIEQDISAVVEQVSSKFEFDKTCSMGSSYGGYSAFMLAIDNPGRYDCVVAMYGVYDLPLLFNSSNLRMSDGYLKAIEKVVGKYDEGMKARSPFRLADKVKVPVLLVAGKEDKVSGFEQSNRMKYALQRVGADVEFLAYNNVGHGHHSWDGENHQAALVSEFLTRKLALQEKHFVDESVRIREALLLADDFWVGGLVAEDRMRAVEHYKRAADLGSARAMYNLGQYFRMPGEHEDLDIAAEWLRLAADYEYAKAPYWLAKLSELRVIEGYGELDVLDLYGRSVDLGYEYAYLDVARLNCLGGEGFERDTDKCLELLTAEFPISESTENNKALRSGLNKERRRVLSQIVSSPRLDDASRSVLREVFRDEYGVNLFDFSLGLDDYGSIDFRRSGWKRFVSSTLDTVNIDQHKRFGVKIQFLDQVDAPKENLKTALVVRWRFPELKDDSGNKQTESLDLFFFSPDEEPIFYYQFDYDWEKIPGDWTVEVLSIDGEVLVSKQFLVVSSDEKL